MNNILLRIYLFVFALFAQGLFSQNHTDGLSDGTLIVNKEKKSL